MGYVSPESMLAVSIVLPVVATICVALRLGQNFWREGKGVKTINPARRLDEVFCVIALIALVATSIIVAIGASKHIIGGHSTLEDVGGWYESVTPDFEYLEKVVYIVFILQPVALGSIKLSFLFFYRRIFQGRAYQITSWIMIGVVTAWMITFTVGFIFDCQLEFAVNWASLAEINAVCGFGFLPTIIYTILDAVLDLAVLILPIPYILQLDMSVQKKCETIFVFLLAGFAVAAAIIRMVIYIETYIPSASVDGTMIMGNPAYDVVGIISAELFWTVVETGVAVIAACLPTIRRSLQGTTVSRIFKSWQSSLASRMGTRQVSEMGSASQRTEGPYSKSSTTQLDSEEAITGKKFSNNNYTKESKYKLDVYQGDDATKKNEHYCVKCGEVEDMV